MQEALVGSLEVVAQDPDFQTFSIADKVAYLQQEVLPKAAPEFKNLTPREQQDYIGQEILPRIKQFQATIRPEVSPAFSGRFQPKPSGFKSFLNEATNAFTADVTDLPTTQGWESLLGRFAGDAGRVGAGTLAGAGIGTLIAPGPGTAIGAGIGGIGSAFAGGFGRAADRMQDQGKGINWGSSLLEGTAEGALQAIGAKQVKGLAGLLKEAARQGLIGAGTGAVVSPASQLMESGKVDPYQTLSDITGFAGGQAVGPLLHGVFKKGKVPSRPIGLKGFGTAEEPFQVTVSKTAEAPDTPKPIKLQTPEEAAQALHEALNHSDPKVRVAAQLNLAKIKRRRNRGTEGGEQARLILDAYSNITKQAKEAAKPKKADVKATPQRLKYIEKMAARMRNTPEGKAQFERIVNQKFSGAEKKAVYGRVKEAEGRAKAKQKVEAEAKKQRREQGEQRQRDRAKARQEKRRKEIAEQNKRLKEQAAKEKEAAKQTQMAAKQGQKAEATPKVMTPAEIEKRADELLEAFTKSQKGTLDAELTNARKSARADYTDAVGKDRSEAVNLTYRRLLDRYNQKKTEFLSNKEAVTPPREKLKGKVEAKKQNLAELNDAVQKGGSYDLTTGKGKQRRLSEDLYTWDEVKDAFPEGSDERQYGEILARAAKEDAEVTIRVDAERVGDTGEFEYKRVAPLGFGVRQFGDRDALFIKAVNKNGHLAEYYVSPSEPNPKTGTVSQMLEEPIFHEDSIGKAKRNTFPNAYYGPRSFDVKELMSRPARQLAGLTSETRAKMNALRDIMDAVDSNREMPDKTSIPAYTLKQTIEAYDDLRKVVDGILEKGNFSDEDIDSLVNTVKKAKRREKMSSDNTLDEATGCGP